MKPAFEILKNLDVTEMFKTKGDLKGGAPKEPSEVQLLPKPFGKYTRTAYLGKASS